MIKYEGGLKVNRFFEDRREFVEIKTQNKSKSLFGFDTPYILDINSLQAYLSLGYVPGSYTLFKDIELITSSSNHSLNHFFSQIPDINHTPAKLKNYLLESIEKNYDFSKNCVVPLSGGMDSRIILAALCEFTEAKNIHTYTFGVSGTYDYEIPNAIARKLGTQHTNFSAENTEYTIEGLIRAAIASDGNTEVFHPLVLNRVVDYYDSNSIFWSGLGGDFVGGGLSDNKKVGTSAQQRLISYEKRNIYFLNNIIDNSFLTPLITISPRMTDYISDSEACFWENHHQRYTRHHILRNDMNIKAPLVDLSLLKFFFTLPESERKDKKYFNQAFSSLFPEVFKFPTKDYGYKYSQYSFLEPLHKAKFYFSALGWRLAPKIFTHPNAAYIDMRHAINHRSDVRNCIDELLADLAKRNIVDNTRMFSFLHEHRNYRKNYTKDLINLASLEVILKAAKL